MLLFKLFEDLFKRGAITVIDWHGKSHEYGDGSGEAVTIRLHDAQVEWDFLRSPKLAMGELYMDERLTLENGSLVDYLTVCARNRGSLKHHNLLGIREYAMPLMNSLLTNNPRPRSRKNVEHAYEIHADFYRLFLDQHMQYSCAYWDYDENHQTTNTLEEAQTNKLHHIARKLYLNQPDLHILDVGCGWGGLSVYLAKEHGARVTGITLSNEQLQAAWQRAEEAGVTDRVDFQICDYRDARPPAGRDRYDRIVSIEMLEHVGVKHYLEYLRGLQKLLDKRGVFLLQWGARMGPPASTNPWIAKYIFPGGYTPSLSEITTAVEKAVYWMNDIECQRLHYADTMREWSRRFQARRDEAVAMYDERFAKMWEFYLAAFEVSSRVIGQCAYQMQLTLDRDVVPQRRDYLYSGS